jgi:hypothetical protein
MERLIRIDDFPAGDKNLFNRKDSLGSKDNYRITVQKVLSIFNEYSIPYILGVSPLLISDEDIVFLNDNVKSGNCVMHGFNHGWDFDDWKNVTSIWKDGGEFKDKTENQLQLLYDESIEIMYRLSSFNQYHFIPPFNCITQNLINVLEKNKVTFLHLCDKEYIDFGYNKLNFHSIKPVISEFKKTYDFANSVIKHLYNESQITLHWCYDCQKKNWENDYITLAQMIKNENN